MHSLRVALAQINTTVGDFPGNTEKIIHKIEDAKNYGTHLIVFPELTLCGYPPEDLLLKESFIRENNIWLKRIIPATKGITALVGYVKRRGQSIFNAAALISDGTLIGSYAKRYLPNYGVFDEKRYFSRGNRYYLFDLNNNRTGITICEDIWIPGGPVQKLAQKAGAGIIVNLSASPYHVGKGQERQEMLSEQCRANGVYIIYCNLVGGQDELVFDGGSLIVDPGGQCLLNGPLFREKLLFCDISVRDRVTIVPRPPQSYRLTKIPLKLGIAPPELPEVNYTSRKEVEEVYEALVLGTRDYVWKNGFKKVVIGLSGGIDSSLTAAIAVESIGCENVFGISMPSIYSSAGTKKDAERVALNLGIQLLTIPIQKLFEGFLSGVKEVVESTPADISEENLQARIRGSILMFLSNKFGWLVLATSNKSEAAVGYCTLYGDSIGGFAPLKDVPKTLVYRLVKFVNSKGAKPVIPESIIKRAPSAELRPAQKDEDSLPPYSVLDPILKLYVEEDLSSGEIVKRGFDSFTVRQVINMVDHSEYKRRQSPPGVKITPKSFGRDRRLPITNKFRII